MNGDMVCKTNYEEEFFTRLQNSGGKSNITTRILSNTNIFSHIFSSIILEGYNVILSYNHMNSGIFQYI